MNWRTLLIPIARTYWKIFQPRTYGVKAVIFHPSQNKKILLVRHSYGNKRLWNLPGGGFNPRRESSASAIKREIHEELNVSFVEFRELCVYNTNAEGKRDEVVIMVGTLAEANIVIGKEISEYVWQDSDSILARGDVARIAKYALEHL